MKSKSPFQRESLLLFIPDTSMNLPTEAVIISN